MSTDEQKRVISIIEDIEHVNSIASELDYEISVANEDERPNLEDQFRRFQGQSNDMVNALKADGYTLDWDGAIVHVSKDGKPWIFKSIHGEWMEDFAIQAKPDDHSGEQAIQGVLTIVLELAEAMTATDVNPTRYISSISSTCICGFVESVDIPQEATVEDITEAIQVLRDNCPQCEEDRRVASIENEDNGTEST